MGYAPPEAIAIGYGNELRSDDGIGQRVAKALHLSNVKSLAVHQLTPELAEALANADLAVFIDACFTSESSQVQVQSLSPESFKIIAGHIGDPRSLLALTQAVYGRCPPAWWIKVPGVNFELGCYLSPFAEIGVAIALKKITQIIDENFSLLL
ncbi:hydrogenase maturation protease [Nostoc linckia FACHB-391]|uniref:Hydrogenase maturation protease n=3 Tax=Nostoc TaxID=1177 RepID=A0ABR8IB11_9NOSO|nr:hydrogenase maturation protease [Nostoc linckia FACHB-391]MBD2648141.1 hydrogenase maturation protease [Nostoc foliaceum FACHB-393]